MGKGEEMEKNQKDKGMAKNRKKAKGMKKNRKWKW